MPGTRVRPPAGPSTSLVPGIHAFGEASKAWMAGTSPAMTRIVIERGCFLQTLRGMQVRGGGLAAFVHHAEAHLLTFDEALHTGALHRADVHEHVLAPVGRLNEA